MSFLADVPDATQSSDTRSWINEAIQRLKIHVFTDEERNGFVGVSGIDARTEGSAAFSAFVNAGLLADRACYETAAERVDHERLRTVITSFPEGFQIWFCKVGQVRLPVGYTGFYPIVPEAFLTAHDRPWELNHRGSLRPCVANTGARQPIWIFNYSIVSQPRRSAQSKTMLESLAEHLYHTPKSGLAAAVLSEASKRVVAQFGMTYRGNMTHDGESESVYAVRL